MKVVLISGKAEAGKDSTASILKDRLTKKGFKVARLAYGDYVKDTARVLWDWDGEKDKAGRELLQWWGTEYVRAKFPDFWVGTVVRLAQVIKDDIDFLLVPDVRFPNEIAPWNTFRFDYITVRVKRPGHKNRLTAKQRKHISETALDEWIFDVVLSAKDMDTLIRRVDKKLLPELLRDSQD
jgi:hypothetical protein